MNKELTKKEAIEYLKIPEKHFDNYFKSSAEIKGYKKRSRWYFSKANLDSWNKLRKKRTVILSIKEYEECFEFAIKMVYSSKTSHGTGIRGVRSEVQMADDFILGILAEHGFKKFLKNKFGTSVKLDMAVHPGQITPQDIVAVKKKRKWKEPKLCIAVKSSKVKSCFNVIPPIEYENDGRKSDIYTFVRVGLPSDHLFRILREHSFFKNVKDCLDNDDSFRKIEELNKIPIWIRGYSKHAELDKVTEIPGQQFEGYRYIKSVRDMHNSDNAWEELIQSI